MDNVVSLGAYRSARAAVEAAKPSRVDELRALLRRHTGISERRGLLAEASLAVFLAHTGAAHDPKARTSALEVEAAAQRAALEAEGVDLRWPSQIARDERRAARAASRRAG